ncbi:MAG: alpha/beta hydrolase family protein, partial [Chloroflexota bacterium]
MDCARRLQITTVILWFVMALLPEPRHASAQLAVAEPAAVGPYGVGLVERSFTRSSSTTSLDRTIEMLIWYPTSRAFQAAQASRFGGGLDAPPARDTAPFPVLLFSHGSGGAPWQSTYLTAHLASHGFVVIAPSHPGNTGKDCPAACLPVNEPTRAAFLDSAQNRPGDVIAALDNVLTLSTGGDPVLGELLDGRRVGVLGHSFGGWTALQVLTRDPRFKAAAPMAPGVFAELLATAEGITTPTLLLAGDLDRLTRIEQERQLSAALTVGGGEHWLVVLRGAGHLSFTDLCGRIFGGCGPDDLTPAEAHAAVTGWITAFMRRHVASDDR